VPDPVTRSAARLALLIALPIALLAGLCASWRLGGLEVPGSAGGSASGSAAPETGAGSPVPMPSRSLTSGDAAACLTLIAHLPRSVRGLAQRPVTAGHEQNAAYGHPPITLRCGGVPLPSLTPESTIWNLSGTCWYADSSRPGATTWTTLGRRVPVAITLPGGYEGQGGWVQEFTASIVASVPSLARPPRQCQAPATGPSSGSAPASPR
jgi:hypothetical protein